MSSLPTVMTTAGLQPIDPATLRQNLTNAVASTNPGYTNSLPGSLIEDITSTDVQALVLMDQMRVELLNSITPFGANAFLLNQCGNLFGLAQGTPTNTSVDVVFSGTAGYVIPPGFVVSDGTNQYAVADGGVINTGGSSDPMTAIATSTGSWNVPVNTVTQIVSAVSAGYTLSVTNPQAGTPGQAAETTAAYRARIMQAIRITGQGVPSWISTFVNAVPGVVANLTRVLQVTGGYEVIVSGGDDAAVANAIFQGVLDIGRIVGSTMSITAITQANPGQVTTLLNHGYSTGQVVTFSGVGGMTELNTGSYAVSVVSEKQFNLDVAPPPVPTLTANTSGGTLPTETIYVKITYVSADGETTPSPETSVAVTGSTGQVVVTSPVAQTGVTGYNVYAANASGSEELQNATPTAIGTNYDINSLSSGATTPSSNTAGVNTTSFTAYTSGGQVLPNLRNVTQTIVDDPNSYSVTFVRPPQQTVTVAVTWNTQLPSFTAVAEVNQLAVAPLAAYINSIPTGQPINLLEMTATFQQAVSAVIATNNVTTLTFAVTINGISVSPGAGTSVIEGDPESYFYAGPTAITVAQG